MARIQLKLVHIPLLTRLFRPQAISRPFRTGLNGYVQRFLVRLQPVQVRFVTSSISFPLPPLSTTSFTDCLTRPQYILIPSSVRSDRNCKNVLVRPIKTLHVSASSHSSLTLQASKKYPSMPPSMPIRKNRSKRKKRSSSTHTDWRTDCCRPTLTENDQGWPNQLSVLSESYICYCGQVTFSSWLVRGQVIKSNVKVFQVQKYLFILFPKKCNRHPCWKRKAASYYWSYSSFSNLQKRVGVGGGGVLLATTMPQFWIVTYVFADDE